MSVMGSPALAGPAAGGTGFVSLRSLLNSPEALYHLVLAMHAKDGLPVKDRTFMFRTHRRCFLGTEAVDWLLAWCRDLGIGVEEECGPRDPPGAGVRKLCCSPNGAIAAAAATGSCACLQAPASAAAALILDGETPPDLSALGLEELAELYSRLKAAIAQLKEASASAVALTSSEADGSAPSGNPSAPSHPGEGQSEAEAQEQHQPPPLSQADPSSSQTQSEAPRSSSDASEEGFAANPKLARLMETARRLRIRLEDLRSGDQPFLSQHHPQPSQQLLQTPQKQAANPGGSHTPPPGGAPTLERSQSSRLASASPGGHAASPQYNPGQPLQQTQSSMRLNLAQYQQPPQQQQQQRGRGLSQPPLPRAATMSPGVGGFVGSPGLPQPQNQQPPQRSRFRHSPLLLNCLRELARRGRLCFSCHQSALQLQERDRSDSGHHHRSSSSSFSAASSSASSGDPEEPAALQQQPQQQPDDGSERRSGPVDGNAHADLPREQEQQQPPPPASQAPVPTPHTHSDAGNPNMSPDTTNPPSAVAGPCGLECCQRRYRHRPLSRADAASVLSQLCQRQVFVSSNGADPQRRLEFRDSASAAYRLHGHREMPEDEPVNRQLLWLDYLKQWYPRVDDGDLVGLSAFLLSDCLAAIQAWAELTQATKHACAGNMARLHRWPRYRRNLLLCGLLQTPAAAPEELQRTLPDARSRACFWLNVHNLLMLHAAVQYWGRIVHQGGNHETANGSTGGGAGSGSGGGGSASADASVEELTLDMLRSLFAEDPLVSAAEHASLLATSPNAGNTADSTPAAALRAKTLNALFGSAAASGDPANNPSQGAASSGASGASSSTFLRRGPNPVVGITFLSFGRLDVGGHLYSLIDLQYRVLRPPSSHGGRLPHPDGRMRDVPGKGQFKAKDPRALVALGEAGWDPRMNFVICSPTVGSPVVSVFRDPKMLDQQLGWCTQRYLDQNLHFYLAQLGKPAEQQRQEMLLRKQQQQEQEEQARLEKEKLLQQQIEAARQLSRLQQAQTQARRKRWASDGPDLDTDGPAASDPPPTKPVPVPAPASQAPSGGREKSLASSKLRKLIGGGRKKKQPKVGPVVAAERREPQPNGAMDSPEPGVDGGSVVGGAGSRGSIGAELAGHSASPSSLVHRRSRDHGQPAGHTPQAPLHLQPLIEERKSVVGGSSGDPAGGVGIPIRGAAASGRRRRSSFSSSAQYYTPEARSLSQAYRSEESSVFKTWFVAEDEGEDDAASQNSQQSQPPHDAEARPRATTAPFSPSLSRQTRSTRMVLTPRQGSSSQQPPGGPQLASDEDRGPALAKWGLPPRPRASTAAPTTSSTTAANASGNTNSNGLARDNQPKQPRGGDHDARHGDGHDQDHREDEDRDEDEDYDEGDGDEGDEGEDQDEDGSHSHDEDSLGRHSDPEDDGEAAVLPPMSLPVAGDAFAIRMLRSAKRRAAGAGGARSDQLMLARQRQLQLQQLGTMTPVVDPTMVSTTAARPRSPWPRSPRAAAATTLSPSHATPSSLSATRTSGSRPSPGTSRWAAGAQQQQQQSKRRLEFSGSEAGPQSPSPQQHQAHPPLEQQQQQASADPTAAPSSPPAPEDSVSTPLRLVFHARAPAEARWYRQELLMRRRALRWRQALESGDGGSHGSCTRGVRTRTRMASNAASGPQAAAQNASEAGRGPQGAPAESQEAQPEDEEAASSPAAEEEELVATACAQPDAQEEELTEEAMYSPQQPPRLIPGAGVPRAVVLCLPQQFAWFPGDFSPAAGSAGGSASGSSLGAAVSSRHVLEFLLPYLPLRHRVDLMRYAPDVNRVESFVHSFQWTVQLPVPPMSSSRAAASSSLASGSPSPSSYGSPTPPGKPGQLPLTSLGLGGSSGKVLACATCDTAALKKARAKTKRKFGPTVGQQAADEARWYTRIRSLGDLRLFLGPQNAQHPFHQLVADWGEAVARVHQNTPVGSSGGVIWHPALRSLLAFVLVLQQHLCRVVRRWMYPSPPQTNAAGAGGSAWRHDRTGSTASDSSADSSGPGSTRRSSQDDGITSWRQLEDEVIRLVGRRVGAELWPLLWGWYRRRYAAEDAAIEERRARLRAAFGSAGAIAPEVLGVEPEFWLLPPNGGSRGDGGDGDGDGDVKGGGAADGEAASGGAAAEPHECYYAEAQAALEALLDTLGPGEILERLVGVHTRVNEAVGAFYARWPRAKGAGPPQLISEDLVLVTAWLVARSRGLALRHAFALTQLLSDLLDERIRGPEFSLGLGGVDAGVVGPAGKPYGSGLGHLRPADLLAAEFRPPFRGTASYRDPPCPRSCPLLRWLQGLALGHAGFSLATLQAAVRYFSVYEPPVQLLEAAAARHKSKQQQQPQ